MKYEVAPAHVYVATHDGLTKIGYSFDPEHRMSVPMKIDGMARGMPSLFWSLKLNPHRVAWLTEQRALGVLCEHEVAGEWLRVSPRLAVEVIMAQVEKAWWAFCADVMIASSRWMRPTAPVIAALGIREDVERGDYPKIWWNAYEEQRLLHKRRRLAKRGPSE